jgi:hypothetical protein
MKVDNDMLGDGRRTRTRKESKQQSKDGVERKEKEKGTAKKHCLPDGFPKYLKSSKSPNNKSHDHLRGLG